MHTPPPSSAALACIVWLVAGAPVVAQIPATAGQVWKTYDIAPFVQAAGPGSERQVVEWILQETGYPAWHGATPASLSADADSLACFHDPEMQARVADVVARFVGEADKPHRFVVRVLGLGSPAWRAEARPFLTPVPAATPGVQAWIVTREDAAVVLARLRARADCRELPTGPLIAAHGLPAVLTGGRSLPYAQDVAPRPGPGPGWQVQNAACDEGLAIDVHPLVTKDGAAVDAVVRCRIDQVERLAPVSLRTPAGNERVQVAVPQVAAVRVGERFRWPATHVLLVGLGLVPWPVPDQNGIGAALLDDGQRCDMVLVVEPRLGAGR